MAPALAAALAWPGLLALQVSNPWRRALVVAGFPLSALALGLAASVPGWVWLPPLALLLLLYPVRAWRDAPVFPTAAAALVGLDGWVRLPAGARILDAGSGLGHGIRALQAVWPSSRIDGLEHSGLLAWWCRLRCPGTRVTRGDMWAASWRAYDLVYLFQRPESMPRAWDKARAEMRAGAWLVSLEFPIPGVAPSARLQRSGERPVLIYRLGGGDLPVPAQSAPPAADKPSESARHSARG